MEPPTIISVSTVSVFVGSVILDSSCLQEETKLIATRIATIVIKFLITPPNYSIVHSSNLLIYLNLVQNQNSHSTPTLSTSFISLSVSVRATIIFW
jgi:hypothetical protein